MKSAPTKSFFETALRSGLLASLPDDTDMLLLDPLRACLELFPLRVCRYDGECINEAEDYADVISYHAAATTGEWQPDPVEISGQFDGYITIRLSLADKRVSWRFKHDGHDWVMEQFIKKLLHQVSTALPGQFVELPTNDQTAAFVYLPHDAAKELKKLARRVLRTVSVDSLVDHYRKGGSYGPLTDFDDRGLSVNQRDARGDTALTAAIKADNELGVMQLLDREGADPTVPDAVGNTPWQLVLMRNNLPVLKRMRRYAWVSMPEGAISDGRKGELAAIIGAFTRDKLPTSAAPADLSLIIEIIRGLPKNYVTSCAGEPAACLFANAQVPPEVIANHAYSLLTDQNSVVAGWVLSSLRRELRSRVLECFEEVFLANHTALDDDAFRHLMEIYCYQHPSSGDLEMLVDDALSRLVALTDIDDPQAQQAIDQIAAALPQELRNRHIRKPQRPNYDYEVPKWVLALIKARTARAAPLYRWVVRENVWWGEVNKKAAEMMASLNLPC